MATTEATAPESLNGKKTETVETVVVRFCGDSGDGMQLAGTQFTNASAVFGNDVSTLPDFPAEIRAPAGYLSRRQRLPALLFRTRYLYPRRHGRHPGCHEPGRAEDEPGRPQARGNADPQRGCVRPEQPRQSRLCD